MPDYDLGTAHGKIKIDADTRGAEEAGRATDGFNKKVRDLSSAASIFNAAADKIDAALNAMKRNYDETDRSVNKLNRDVDDLSGGISAHASVTRRANDSTREWTGSLEGLHSRLLGVNEMLAMYGPAAVQVARMAKSFKDFGGTDRTVLNLTRSFLSIGGASTVFNLVRSRFLGMGKALAMAPVYQQQIVGMANSFRLLTFGVGLLTKYEVVGKAWSRTAQAMTRHSQDAGLAMLMLGDGVEKAVKPILPAINWIRQLNSHLDGMAGGAANTIGGLALMRSGFAGLNRSFGIFGRNFQTGNFYMDAFIRGLKFVFLPSIVLSGAAIQSFGKLLEWTSNLVAGLWDGIKQLSGGFLAIPGLIANIGAAVGTGAVIFGTLKDALKEIGKAKGDIDKINEAIAAMPPYLRPLGQAVADLTPKWKDFQNTLTATFITGADTQLRALANGALPLLMRGSDQVSNSFRIAKDQIVNFAAQGKTLSFLLDVFSNTAQIINAMSSALPGAAGGLRDIARVGSDFIRDFSIDSIGLLSEKFNNFAQAAVASGKATEWMHNSVRGVRDLVNGTLDAVRATYTLLTIFKTPGSDQDFLHKYAVDLAKFNDAVQRSSQSGLLRRIGDDVRSWGTDKIRDAVTLFKELEPAIKAAYSILQQMSASFSSTLLPLLQLVASAFSGIIQTLNFLGAGTIIGSVLGITTAFSLMMKVLAPLGNLIKIVIGALAFKSGAEAVILGVVGALEKLGPMGVRAGSALSGVGDTIAGMAGKIAGVIGIIVTAFESYETQSRIINDGNQAIATSSQHATEAISALQDAFYKDKGEAGANVATAMKNSVDTMLADFKEAGAKTPGILDSITGTLGAAFTGNLSEFFKVTGFEDMSKKASDALNKVGLSSQNLADIIQNGGPAYDDLIKQLSGMGTGGITAANQIISLHGHVQALAGSLEVAGPGAAQLATGIKQLASAGGDAITKLDALKTSLQGLGLLKTDDFQAVADYAKSIRDLGDAAQTAADPTQGFGDVIDKQTGLLNAASVNGGNLLNVLRPVAENFLNLAAHGHDVNQMYQDLQPQIQKVASDFQVSADSITATLAAMGVDPKIIKVLLSITGKDDFSNELKQVLVTAEANIGNGIEVPITLKTPQDAQTISDQVNKILGPGKSRAEGYNVFLEPGLSASDPLKLGQGFMSNVPGKQPPGPNVPNPLAPGSPLPPQTVGPQGGIKSPNDGLRGLMIPPGIGVPQYAPTPFGPADIRSPNVPIGVAGAQIPLPPGVGIPAPPEPAPPPQPKKGKEDKPPKSPEPLPKGFQGLGLPPPLIPPGISGPIPKDTMGEPAGVAGAVTPVAPPPPGQPPALASATVPTAQPPGAVAGQPAPVKIAVDTSALDTAQAKVQGFVSKVGNLFNELQISMSKSIMAVLPAVDQMISQTMVRLNAAGAAAQIAGTKFGQDFAAGIVSGTSLTAIANSAAKAAQTAQDRMPQNSPAKYGPLSGSGWSGIAGKKFSTDFAGGVSSGISNISSSVKEAAAAAHIVFAGLTKGVPDQASAFLKQFGDLNTLVGNFQKLATSAFNTGSKFLTAMSDPFKTGGFFGKPLPYQRDPNVTAEDLKQKRQQGDTAIGGDLTGGATSLAGVNAPSKEQIAAAIVGEAQKRGYDRNTAIGAISAGLHESGLDSVVTNASDHKGIFQEDSSYKDRATAQGQISDFFDRLDQLGGPGSQSLKADPLDTIASQIEKGGYTGAALAQHASTAAQLYDSVLGKAGAVGVGPDAAFAGAQGYQDNPASRAKDVPSAPNVEAGIRQLGLSPLYAPGSTTPPQWMQELASKFNLTASTYSTGGSLHQMGFAADFMGDPKMMEAFAQYIRQNLAGQTLQLIHQGASGQKYGIASGQEVGPGTSQPNYYSGNWAEEGSMVHWATDVAPILGAANATAASGQNDAVLNQLRTNNSTLDEAIKVGQNPSSTDQQVADSLQTIKQLQIQQNQGNTPESKQSAQALDSVASSISGQRGMRQSQDPISSASGVISGASQIAGDVIGDINDTIQAIGATKNTADMLVRGIANTQDVMKVIDNTQQWLSTFAAYAQTVGDVANEVGQIASIAGQGEPGGGSAQGIASIIGGVADAISGALQGINEAIDIGQEIYQIWGSYYGDFLGFLGGGNNSLRGNIQYLLDQNTNQLLAYSTDNPMHKVGHQTPGHLTNLDANNQAIGQLNYYAGPGTDARQATRDMMFQVKAAGYAGATSV